MRKLDYVRFFVHFLRLTCHTVKNPRAHSPRRYLETFLFTVRLAYDQFCYCDTNLKYPYLKDILGLITQLFQVMLAKSFLSNLKFSGYVHVTVLKIHISYLIYQVYTVY